jgi:flavin reductase (DIM6/NTAB) family NADH-FMN oxidoreductase RutF
VAPFSYYLPITGDPMLLGITFGQRATDGQTKHSFRNLLRTGDLVVNVCTEHYATDHIETIAREYGEEVSEFEVVGWTPVPSTRVTSPGVAEAPARLECRVLERHPLGRPGAQVELVVAEVVWVHLDPSVVAVDHRPDHPRIDLHALSPIGRSGARTFVRCLPEGVYYQERTAVPAD